VVAAEAACLLLFGQWYVARYYLLGIHFPILVVMSMCIVSVALIFLGGIWWDARHPVGRASTSQVPNN
jgi:hypothetical protein